MRESASVEALKRANSPGLYKNLPAQLTTFDGRYKMTSAFQVFPTSTKGTLPSSYSIPFTRTNQDHNLKKFSIGFMNESTYSNACDPNTMTDQGHSRNAVYNVVLEGHPDIRENSYSKALFPPESLNKSFYSFGG